MLIHFRSLYNNKIKCIQKGTFSALRSLSTLNLISNPFECNCALLWLKDALRKSNLVAGNPKCALPAHLRDQAIINLEDAAFGCDWSSNSASSSEECPEMVSDQAKWVDSAARHLSAIQTPKHSPPSISSCPTNCSCSTNGVVRCSHSGLTHIPLSIPITVREL